MTPEALLEAIKDKAGMAWTGTVFVNIRDGRITWVEKPSTRSEGGRKAV